MAARLLHLIREKSRERKSGRMGKEWRREKEKTESSRNCQPGGREMAHLTCTISKSTRHNLYTHFVEALETLDGLAHLTIYTLYT